MSDRLETASRHLAYAEVLVGKRRLDGVSLSESDRENIETLVRLAYAHIDLDRREAEEERENG